ncbi:MAG TPA: Clp protease N-terminal domain-containing protein [Gemmatimonadales bacterium]|nr:Clp protease N-terminal domain-containing protein [Gemmatimonadales bacterium]
MLAPAASPTLRTALEQARRDALRRGHDRIATRHLALAVLAIDEGPLLQALQGLGLDAATLRLRLESSLPRARRPRPESEDLPFSANAQRALGLAARLAGARGETEAAASPEHLLVALLALDGDVARLLRTAGLREPALRAHLARLGGPGPSLAFLALQPSSGVPVYQQIVAQLREAVALGRLQADDRLPTVRQLAAHLGVAPGTTARAYQELEQLGVVVTDGARGTRVARRRPSDVSAGERAATLVDLLRPVAVAASYLGASADEVRAALEDALEGILHRGEPAAVASASPSAL